MQLTIRIVNSFQYKFSFRKSINSWAFLMLILFSCFFGSSAFGQDNSPYSRYGLGDIVPQSNIIGRSLGGISATYVDYFSINYNNPATLGSVQAYKEQTTNKMAYGRAILDLGISIDNRTMREPNTIGKFTAYNTTFSHLQVSVPLHHKLGLSFGLRPITRTKYNLGKKALLKNLENNTVIDSVYYTYEGSGGSYLANVSIGHKFSLSKTSFLSIGASGGYLFGQKEINSIISFRNDSTNYQTARYQSLTSYDNIFATGGLLFETKLNKNLFFGAGFFGNMQTTLNGKQDVKRETVQISSLAEDVLLDSVLQIKGGKGEIVYPSDFTFGIKLEKPNTTKSGGWMWALDYQKANWDNYKFFGAKDANISTSWSLKTGIEIKPSPKDKSYFSYVAYRTGLFFGRDNYNVNNNKLPIFGASIGFGLPLLSTARFSPGNVSVLNTAFEFIKRGNNNTPIKENIFRISLGFSLSDFWFIKPKYE